MSVKTHTTARLRSLVSEGQFTSHVSRLLAGISFGCLISAAVLVGVSHSAAANDFSLAALVILSAVALLNTVTLFRPKPTKTEKCISP